MDGWEFLTAVMVASSLYYGGGVVGGSCTVLAWGPV
jgi:hypothetical protein